MKSLLVRYAFGALGVTAVILGLIGEVATADSDDCVTRITRPKKGGKATFQPCEGLECPPGPSVCLTYEWGGLGYLFCSCSGLGIPEACLEVWKVSTQGPDCVPNCPPPAVCPPGTWGDTGGDTEMWVCGVCP